MSGRGRGSSRGGFSYRGGYRQSSKEISSTESSSSTRAEFGSEPSSRSPSPSPFSTSPYSSFRGRRSGGLGPVPSLSSLALGKGSSWPEDFDDDQEFTKIQDKAIEIAEKAEKTQTQTQKKRKDLDSESDSDDVPPTQEQKSNQKRSRLAAKF